MIEIHYVDHMGSDNTIANTARGSMGETQSWDELPEGYSEEQRDRLVNYLAKHQHSSPFRHTSIAIRCQVPVFLARQLGKHQTGLTWNETSRRYSTDAISFFTPEEWRRKPDTSIKQGSGAVFDEPEQLILQDWYQNVLDVCSGTYYAMLDMDVAPEQARMVLPQSMNVPYVWTGSLTAFAHVYNLRADGHAQKEAQDFARQLDKVIEPLFPVSWKVLTGRKVS